MQFECIFFDSTKEFTRRLKDVANFQMIELNTGTPLTHYSLMCLLLRVISKISESQMSSGNQSIKQANKKDYI